MKKSLFILATAAIALASCNNDVKIAENKTLGNNPQEIALVPFAQRPLRAASTSDVFQAVSDANYPKNYSMDVSAQAVVGASAQNYFELTNFTFDNTTKWWNGSTKRYWPLAPATVNFLAVSNWTKTSVVSTTMSDPYASTATITLGDNKPTEVDATWVQHDLMYAYGRATVNQAGNALSFPDKVDMTFKHALAWVDFQVKGNSAVEQGAITLNSITLNNARYAGKYQVNVTNYDKAEGAGNLSFGTCQWLDEGIGSPVATQEVKGYSAATLPAAYTSVGYGLLVIPTGSKQTTGISFDSFTLNYSINGATFNYTYTPTAEQRTLEAGKKYIFQVNFTLHEIFINASVENWNAQTPVDVEVPETASYAITEATHTFNIPATAGTYYVRVTGCAADPTVTPGLDIFSVDPAKSSYLSGTAVVSFTVAANDSDEKTGTFTVNDGTNSTTITVSQAAGN